MFDLDQPPPAPPHRGANWMVTLVDLVSLLVSFFVLAYAGSLVPTPAGSGAGSPLRAVFEGLLAPQRPSATADGGATDPAYLAAVLGPAIAADPALAGDGGGRKDAVSVAAVGDRLVLEVPQKRVFYPHSGTMKPEARVMLAAIVPHLARLRLPEIVAVETGSGSAGRRLALVQGRAVLAGLRGLGVAQRAPVFAIPAATDAPTPQRRACAAAATPGDGRAVVVCLSGGG